MMNIQINPIEALSFLGMLIRVSTLMALAPFFGDRLILTTVKILFSLSMSVVLYPMLKNSGAFSHIEATGILTDVLRFMIFAASEVIVGAAMAFSGRICFDTILFTSNWMGGMMGLASATMFDPHQESQSQVLSEIIMALAMLMFLAIDGHYGILAALTKSFEWVPLGQAFFGESMVQTLVSSTAKLFTLGFQIALPFTIVTLVLNLVLGLIAKSMPQMNILVLSFGLSAMVGIALLYFSIGELQVAASEVLGEVGNQMATLTRSLRSGI
jgi:flagellar biosynthetic protein FliR